MKMPLILGFLLLFLNTTFPQDNFRIQDAQQQLAARIVREIEKNNIDSVFKYFDSAYLKGQQPKLKALLVNFQAEYKTLIPGTRRFITPVYPTGFNLFRFSYIDSTGTALQIDLSFKNNDINSKVLLLETVDRLTLKKQREQSLKGAGVRYESEPERRYPYTTTLQLRNCSKEMRTVTFNSQVGFFKWWVFGKTDLESNKVVYFSKEYQIDSNFLRENINKVKKSLPKNFWTLPMGEMWYDNEPNEDAIWFIQIFAQVDKSGKIKIYSAYKITFEGNDARIDHQRANPKIRNIEFITEKEAIQALERKLKLSPKSG